MIDWKRIQQNPQIRKSLPWITAVVVFAVGYPWFFGPIHQTVLARSQSRHMETLYQERLQRLRQIINRQKDQLKKWSSSKLQSDSLLFDPSEADEFFSTLNETAVSLNCCVVSAEYQSGQISRMDLSKTDSPVELRGAGLQITGPYNRWISLLTWMESQPQCILIESLELESQKDRPGVLHGRLTLSIPVMRTNKSVQKSERTQPKEK